LQFRRIITIFRSEFSTLMRRYFILQGQVEKGPFTVEMLQGELIYPNTLIREENSYSWTTAGQVEELADIFETPTSVKTFSDPVTTIQVAEITKIKPKRSRILKSGINEKFIPLFIVFAIGSIIVSMDWVIETKSTRILEKPPSVAIKPAQSSIAAKPAPPSVKPAINKPEEVAKIEKIVISNKPALSKPLIKNELEDKSAYYKRNWERFITLSNNNYNRGFLGGIKGLTLTFKNDTDFPIDEMVAKVIYIKANGKEWINKTVTVYNLLPHSEKQQSVAKVNRGKSIKTMIEKVTSSKMHLYYTLQD
jgi:hypothetical protein